MRYIAWDAHRFAGEAKKAEEIEAELLSRLDFIALAATIAPDLMSEPDEKVRDAIQASVARLKHTMSQRRDYFGHPENHTPLGSPDLYLRDFKASLKVLKEREAMYLKYMKSLEDGQRHSENRGMALAQSEADIQTHDANHDALRESLLSYKEEKIPAADQARVEALDKLTDALMKLQNWVKSCFGLTVQDFTSTVFNLAFVNGPFTGLTTAVSQGGGLIDKAINTLPNDDGQAVSRRHLLLKVMKFGKKLDKLDEAWEAIKAGIHDDDPEMVAVGDQDAYRLLVEQSDFNNLLQQFYAKDEARAAMDAMDDYVEAVQARNAVLANYNALVGQFLRVATERSTAQGYHEQVDLLRTQEAQPDLPSEAAFVAALYSRSRENCIRYCYDASQAIRLWSLMPDTALFETLQLGSPTTIDHQFLSGVQESLFRARTDTITAQMKSILQDFPPEEAGYKGSGFSLVLRPDQYPHEFQALRRDGVAIFTIPMPTSQDASPYRLEIMPLVMNEASIPDSGRNNVVIVAQLLSGELYFRIFDSRGKVILSMPHSNLPKGSAPYFAELKRQLGSRLKPLEYTPPPSPEEEKEILDTIATVLDTSVLSGEANPFLTLANVRLTKVRPWVRGIRSSSDMCHVHLSHLGAEQFRRTDRTVVDLVHYANLDADHLREADGTAVDVHIEPVSLQFKPGFPR
jgi:hypothetical protein